MALPAIDRFVQALGADTQAHARNTSETARIFEFSIARFIRSANKTIASSDKYRNTMLEFADYLSSFKDIDHLKDGIFDLDDALPKIDRLLEMMRPISDKNHSPYISEDFYRSIDRLVINLSRKSSDSGRIVRRLSSKLKVMENSLVDSEIRVDREVDRMSLLIVELRNWVEQQIEITKTYPLLPNYNANVKTDYANKRKSIMKRYERSLAYLAQ